MPEAGKPGGSDPFRLYLILAPILYLAFALLTPPFQTPDEHQHLFRAWQLSGGGIIAEKRGNGVGGDLPPGVLKAAEAELGTLAPHAWRGENPRPWAERLSRATPVAADQPWVFANFLGSAPYSPAGYGPQVIAIWTGKVLGLSVEAIVRLGRLFNAALAFALIALAMRMLPMGRSALLVVGLLPMTAACAGSFGQDGLVIGAAALLVAMGLRAAFVRPWTGRDGLLAGLLAAVLTLAKFVYLPLAAVGLFAGMRRQGHMRRQALRPAVPPLLATLAAGLLFAAWFALVSGLTVPMMPGRPLPSDQLRHVLAHPLAFPAALAGTFNLPGLFGLSLTLVNFGWLTVGPVAPAWFASSAAVLIVLLLGTGEGPRLAPVWRGWLLAICLGVVLLLSFALYLAATALGGGAVDGLQGRYFIPLFLPLLLALGRQGASARANVPLLAAGLMLLANLFALAAIARAFHV
ncbi:MAG: DUF2142 domain-containing protein [Novosphingobium sp.]